MEGQCGGLGGSSQSGSENISVIMVVGSVVSVLVLLLNSVALLSGNFGFVLAVYGTIFGGILCNIKF